MKIIVCFFLSIFSFFLFSNINFADSTNTILMVPPNDFGYNPQTAPSNKYQTKLTIENPVQQAMAEFNHMVSLLRSHDINVITMEQKKGTPDAVFPNNWFSTHLDQNGQNLLILYPMLAPNRQKEVNPDKLINALDRKKIKINKIIDLRNAKNQILEGTGSVVLDRKNSILYASLSERTNESMVNYLAEILHFQPIIFTSTDKNNHPIYHTNVMMGLSDTFAVICLDCIKDKTQRANVINHLSLTKKLIIPITQSQVSNMCGNVITLKNAKNQNFTIMSEQAYQHFSKKQLMQIQLTSQIIPVPIKTIETIGGGSARCMIAEIFFKK